MAEEFKFKFMSDAVMTAKRVQSGDWGENIIAETGGNHLVVRITPTNAPTGFSQNDKFKFKGEAELTYRSTNQDYKKVDTNGNPLPPRYVNVLYLKGEVKKIRDTAPTMGNGYYDGGDENPFEKPRGTGKPGNVSAADFDDGAGANPFRSDPAGAGEVNPFASEDGLPF